MIRLTLVKYCNACALEASWQEVTGEGESQVITPLFCRAYPREQISELRNEIEVRGGKLAEHEALIYEFENGGW